MGRFLNPGNEAFSEVIHSEIYVDKTPLLEYTNNQYDIKIYLPKLEYRTAYPALMVELKWNKSTDTAIEQIQDKKYPDSILEYTGDILLVGINYDKKTKEHECRIEKIKK